MAIEDSKGREWLEQLKGVNSLPLFKQTRHKWYPNMIYHTSTKNTSFLRESKRLKMAGVKNYDWMLVLLQPELEFVDPHDPNLTAEQAAMVAVECRYNPIYYFREVVRLKAETTEGWSAYKASRLNLSQLFLYFCGVGALYVAPRQQGKTTGIFILDWYLMLFWFRNARINLFTIAIKNGLDAIALMKQVRDMTPNYLFNLSYADGDGREKLRYAARNNEWSFIVNANSVHDADSKGRGLTSGNPRWDEFAYIKHLEKTLMAALPGTTTAMEQAEESGLPNGRIYATTAGELDTASGAYAYSVAMGAYQFTEMLYDTESRNHIRQVVEAGSSSQSLVYAEFSYVQLGKDIGWLERQRLANGYDRLTLEKDFLNIWVRGSSEGLVTKVHRDRLTAGEAEPLYTEIGDNLVTFRWHIPENEIQRRLDTEPSILTVDTSDGIGNDGNGVYLMSTNTTETYMTTSINEVNLLNMALNISRLLIKHKRMVLNIEAKNVARAMIDIIVIQLVAAGEDPFKRIYNSVVSNPEEHKALWDIVKLPMGRRPKDIYTRAKKLFGFNTSSDTRNLLYGTVLSTALKNSAALIKDKQLIGELLGLTIKNGRIDHQTSKHDDLVIAWLIGHWTLIFGQNLSFYGISPDKVMQMVSEKGGLATEEERLAKAKVALLRQEIDSYKEKLSNVDNLFLQFKYENKLKTLINSFSFYTDEPISYTDIVADIDEQRALKKGGKWKKFG